MARVAVAARAAATNRIAARSRGPQPHHPPQAGRTEALTRLPPLRTRAAMKLLVLRHRALLPVLVLIVFYNRGDGLEHVVVALLHRVLQIEVLDRNVVG